MNSLAGHLVHLDPVCGSSVVVLKKEIEKQMLFVYANGQHRLCHFGKQPTSCQYRLLSLYIYCHPHYVAPCMGSKLASKVLTECIGCCGPGLAVLGLYCWQWWKLRKGLPCPFKEGQWCKYQKHWWWSLVAKSFSSSNAPTLQCANCCVVKIQPCSRAARTQAWQEAPGCRC